ncbi:MAG: hypothetical protein IKS90_07795 [Clostridia bacterium]|nr:hypothetical protein [Clostridia bacterium]
MKKVLLFIAVAAILLTIVSGAFHINREAMHNEAMTEVPNDVKRFSGIHEVGLIIVLIAIVACEIGLFSGIALILSKNRTPLKLVFGIVIVIISLFFWVGFIRSFFGFYTRSHEEPMVDMMLLERLPGL